MTTPRSGSKALLALMGVFIVAGCASSPRRPPPGRLAAGVSCADFSFPIYFETNQDKLTSAAQAVLAAEAQRTKGCKVSKVEVVGLADADGPAHRNLVLSRQRAAMVAHTLEAAGLPAPVFDIDAIGETGAKAGGAVEPLRRRSEVVVHQTAPH